ncbi:hypothetical protein SAMN05661080_03470 [Modestobacter sp. DSM 44400]|nr:hypothetical protein SAMN05661080_03470 [Modestobacter sp. DSM 44400]
MAHGAWLPHHRGSPAPFRGRRSRPRPAHQRRSHPRGLCPRVVRSRRRRRRRRRPAQGEGDPRRYAGGDRAGAFPQRDAGGRPGGRPGRWPGGVMAGVGLAGPAPGSWTARARAPGGDLDRGSPGQGRGRMAGALRSRVRARRQGEVHRPLPRSHSCRGPVGRRNGPRTRCGRSASASSGWSPTTCSATGPPWRPVPAESWPRRCPPSARSGPFRGRAAGSVRAEVSARCWGSPRGRRRGDPHTVRHGLSARRRARRRPTRRVHRPARRPAAGRGGRAGDGARSGSPCARSPGR